MAIATTGKITNLLNGTISVTKTLIPMEFNLGKPQAELESLHTEQVGVQIGLEKDINGSLIFLGPKELFSQFGNQMYGMPFEGEMLDSFIGELGNMLAGNIATHLSNEEITIDITPPRVIDQVSITDAAKMLSVPLKFQHNDMTIIFAIF